MGGNKVVDSGYGFEKCRSDGSNFRLDLSRAVSNDIGLGETFFKAK